MNNFRWFGLKESIPYGHKVQDDSKGPLIVVETPDGGNHIFFYY